RQRTAAARPARPATDPAGSRRDHRRDELVNHGRLTEGDSGTSPPAGSCPQGCSSSVWFGEKSPVLVSEGGLEPPCPLRALAPQASASAYSATRTRDARGTHRLSYLSKPNAPRRVP